MTLPVIIVAYMPSEPATGTAHWTPQRFRHGAVYGCRDALCFKGSLRRGTTH